MKVGAIVIIVLIVFVLVFSFVPLYEVSYTVNVDYQEIETYYEDEPYEETETYIEAIPLSYDATRHVKTDTIEEHQQVIIGGIVLQDEVVEVPIEIACVDVENTDDIAGSFTISFSGITPMFGASFLTAVLEIDPGEEKTAECPAEHMGNWSYKVTPSTKDQEEERTVTKYKQVEKQRTVVKQRPELRYEKVSILAYLLNYN